MLAKMLARTFNAFCRDLPATTHVVQWGGADVWKVGGKVFAIGGDTKTGDYAARFKVSEMAWDIFRDHPGCIPAPYMASRGLKWIQAWKTDGMDDDTILDLIRDSHAMIAAALPKTRQRALGLV